MQKTLQWAHSSVQRRVKSDVGQGEAARWLIIILTGRKIFYRQDTAGENGCARWQDRHEWLPACFQSRQRKTKPQNKQSKPNKPAPSTIPTCPKQNDTRRRDHRPPCGTEFNPQTEEKNCAEGESYRKPADQPPPLLLENQVNPGRTHLRRRRNARVLQLLRVQII
ncbi:hypothetical protein AA103581_0411 [Gluconobacter wancherniae NBRC 103581]|nr:hypothetical protein AA103581_0411 [Gluconobacter wancherniae NBRC 103581]